MNEKDSRLYVKREVDINYSNVGENNLIKPVEIARLFQDMFLLQDRLMNLKPNEKDTAWILLNYDMNIYRYARIGEKVEVITYPYSFNRFYGNRMFLMKDERGEIIAEAKSKWLYVDRTNLKIKRITADVMKDFGDFKTEKGRGFEIDDVRLEELKDAERRPFSPRHDDIDFNSHVNNTVYFSLFYDYTPAEILENYKPYKIQVMYKKQILLGETVFVNTLCYEDDGQRYTEYLIHDGKDANTTVKVL